MTADYGPIFEKSTAALRQAGLYDGVHTMKVWRGVFADMRTRLLARDAPVAEQQTFREALERAIDAASDQELTADERRALHAVVRSVFEGRSAISPTDLAPKAQFLRRVTFAG